jgi:tetratricopeptide (TPR) repeat protein
MRSSFGSVAAGLALAGLVAGCATRRETLHTEANPFDLRRPASVPLPDPTEKMAARMTALVLADRPDTAAAALQTLQEEDLRREAAGEAPTGLVDNARDLLHTLSAPNAYREQSARLLDEEEVDAVLQRRLELQEEQDPLRVAERRIREDRITKIASVFNRLVAPLSKIPTGAALNPIETGRATISALLSFYSFPEATTQERQALRAYQEFLERNPESPDAEWVVERFEHYQAKWLRQLHGEAIESAERALEVGRPDVALAHLDRADRLIPEDEHAGELRYTAREAVEDRELRVDRTMRAKAFVGIPLDEKTSSDLHGILVASLIAPPDEIAMRARTFEESHGPGPLSDELMFLETFEVLDPRNEDPYFEAVHEVARLDPRNANMARHARRVRNDPESDPYLHYRRAQRADRRERLRHIFLGRHANGPRDRDWWRPLEWLIEVPSMVMSVAKTPVRVVQYPGNRRHFGGNVIKAGERYLTRFPHGAHADDVHRNLESLYAQRGRSSGALKHHQARLDPDPDEIAEYREQVAEQLLMAARLERRWDVRSKIYESIIEDYAETPQARIARKELHRLLTETTPQNIRLSREFLLENPELWGPGALGLRRELMDGEKENGEIAEEGITLVGRTFVRIELEGREPVLRAVPEEHFARFVALLEETYYQRVAEDTREIAVRDPQRELFFERARLGLLGHADARPTATSDSAFLSTHEKHGYLRRATPLLPVELIVRGGLEDFGLSAYPRIRTPAATPDAWLYR